MIGVEGHFRARQPEHEPRIVCADRLGDTQYPGLQRLNTSSRNQFLSLAESVTPPSIQPLPTSSTAACR